MSPVHCPSKEEEKYQSRHFFAILDKVPPSRLRAITIIVPLISLFIVAFAPIGMDQRMQFSLAILLCVSMLWTFGMIPLAVTALLVPVLLAGFGVFSPVEALMPFAAP